MLLRAAAVTLAAALLAARAGPATGQAFPLAGLLPLDDFRAAHWPWSGAWTWPVGAELDYTQPVRDGEPGWKLLRGCTPRFRRIRRHLGADLGNGRGGDPVRAAAHGLVVVVRDRPDRSGFGRHVVVAHRLREGGFAYSVYAHLQPGTIAVAEGQCVWAGQPLGTAGRSGHASTNHLHFEVRLADDPAQRWEHTRTVDPLEFVAAHLPHHAADISGTGPYVDWADRAGLFATGTRAGDELAREDWQIMLARAACVPALALPAEPAALGDSLIAWSVRDGSRPARPEGRVDWRDLAGDLTRLAERATRLPPGPLGGGPHRELCLTRYGMERPSAEPGILCERAGSPTVADACVLLADVATRAQVSAPPADGSR